MTSLEKGIDTDFKMDTGVIFNRVVVSKSNPNNRGVEPVLTRLADHLANKPGAVEALRSLRNDDTQK